MSKDKYIMLSLTTCPPCKQIKPIIYKEKLPIKIFNLDEMSSDERSVLLSGLDGVGSHVPQFFMNNKAIDGNPFQIVRHIMEKTKKENKDESKDKA